MNKADLEKLGLTAEALEKAGLTADALDKIIVLHGKDIEGHKAKIEAAKTETDALKGQLVEAGKTIESFKGLDIEGVKKTADEWKAKADEYKTQAEKAATDAEAKLSALKFDHALDSALTGAKAKNAKAVRALLKLDDLKLTEEGSISGLKEQLETLQKENDYLFESDQPAPKVVAGGSNTKLTEDAFAAAMRRGAQLPEPK